MNKTQQERHEVRAGRSFAIVVVLTGGSLYTLGGDVHPPHGNVLLYAFAMSWLIAIPIGLASSALLTNLSPEVFSLARWEKEGEIYDRVGIRAFRWVLLRSPLGWINPNIHLSAGRTDCDRLPKELNTAEGVHWLVGFASVAMAIWYVVDDLDAYGYSLLLINIPFNLYPIMLQRWNRGRVSRALTRRQRRALRSST